MRMLLRNFLRGYISLKAESDSGILIRLNSDIGRPVE